MRSFAAGAVSVLPPLVGAFLIVVLLPTPADARILRVSPSGDGFDGTTWERAYNSLSNALIAAASGDDLWVSGAVYPESIDLKSGVDLFGGFSGSEEENEFDLRDWKANETIIDSTGLNDSVIKGVSVEFVTIDGLVLTGGRATYGGGAHFVDSEIHVQHCRIERNVTVSPGDNGGGGVYAKSSKLYLEFVEIAYNTGRSGGGVNQEGGELEFFKCLIGLNGSQVGEIDQGGVVQTLVGGGLRTVGEDAVVTFRETEVSGNVSGGGGGGLYLLNGDEVNISKCSIIGNSASGAEGGGVYSFIPSTRIVDSTISGNSGGRIFPGAGGGLCLRTGGWIENCLISENRAFGGGGIYIASGDTTILGCTIERNQSSDGGGVRFATQGFGQTVLLSRSLIRDNTGERGGGISLNMDGVTIEDCIIERNHAARWPPATFNQGLGGGIEIQREAAVNRCRIVNNEAQDGGGGIFLPIGGDGIFSNCTIQGNTAGKRGGAVFLVNRLTNPTFTNCTIVNNHAPDASGLLVNESLPTFLNCILINSSTDEIREMKPSSYQSNEPITKISYSNVSGGWPGEGNIDEDPHFLDPENGDYRLQSSSPCVDSASTEGPIDDLDGNPRPRDVGGIGRDGLNAFDMGAYEVQTPFSNSRTDVNGDGRVDAIDLLMWMGDWMKEAD